MSSKVLSRRAEYVLVRLLLSLTERLDPVTASDAGARLARWIGPRLSVSRVAWENLRALMPKLDDRQRVEILRGVWENLGRTAAEFPHIARLTEAAAGPGYEIVGAEHLMAPPAHQGPAIYVSAHYGNWEVLPLIVAAQGAAFAPVYRALANDLVNDAIQALRGRAVGRPLPAFPKGGAGGLAAAAYLARGGRLGMLVDQKFNEGIAVPFLGCAAMTTRFPAALALRLRCPIIPGRVDRIGPFRFRLTVEPPLPLPDTGDRDADIRTLTIAINDTIERWIRARPESWLWLHRRWSREALHRPGPGDEWHRGLAGRLRQAGSAARS